MNWQTFIQSEFFWETVIGVWVTQIVTTAIVAAKAPKTGWVWRAIRALHGLLDKLDPKIPPGPIAGILLACWSLYSVTGCMGTFEESAARYSAGPRKAADPAECRRISSAAKWEKATSIGFGALSGASGIATWPIESKDGRLGLAIASGVSAAGTVVFLSLWGSDADEYLALGCGTLKSAEAAK